MVKIKMEIKKDKWLLIETVPLTPKTNSDFKNRIPKDTLLWRPIYLNRIIKEPKISMEDWGNIPVGFIDSIYNCIHDVLLIYTNQNSTLETILDEIEKCPIDDYEHFNKLVEDRDSLISKIDDIENNRKIFKYSSKEIREINRNALSLLKV